MFSINTRLTAILLLTLMLASTSAAQQAQTAPPAAPKESNYVEEKGFKTKIIEVKYRNADALYQILRNLGSGVKGALISPNSEFKLLTVRDSNLCLRCHAQIQGPATGGAGHIFMGNKDHTSFLRYGTCWTAGCHSAVHGSNTQPYFFY